MTRRDLTCWCESISRAVIEMHDGSPHDASVGIIVAFAEGHGGRALSEATEPERRTVFLKTFERFFGSRAANPWCTSRRTGPPTRGHADATAATLEPACGRSSVRRCGGRVDGSTGQGPRRPSAGAATWTRRPLGRTCRPRGSRRRLDPLTALVRDADCDLPSDGQTTLSGSVGGNGRDP